MAQRDEWKEAARRAIGSAELRDLSSRIGVSHTYLGNWRNHGTVPARQYVLALAAATVKRHASPQERAEWTNWLLQAAGYAPESDDHWSPEKAFLRGLIAIEKELGRPIWFSTDDARIASQTQEQVEAALAAIRARELRRAAP